VEHTGVGDIVPRDGTNGTGFERYHSSGVPVEHPKLDFIGRTIGINVDYHSYITRLEPFGWQGFQKYDAIMFAQHLASYSFTG
jgi:hypothetical protein